MWNSDGHKNVFSSRGFYEVLPVLLGFYKRETKQQQMLYSNESTYRWPLKELLYVFPCCLNTVNIEHPGEEGEFLAEPFKQKVNSHKPEWLICKWSAWSRLGS